MHSRSVVLILFITVLSLLNPTLAQPTGSIAGKILDPNGSPLSDVKVEIYSHGNLVQTLTTGYDGSFVVSLPQGVYTIKLSKEHFVTKSLSVTVRAWDTTHLGEVELDYSIFVAVPVNEVVIRPGDSFQMPLNIRNMGENVEEVRVFFNSPEGFRVKLVYQSLIVRRLILQPGDKILAHILVDSPLSTGTFNLTIVLSIGGGLNLTRDLVVISTLEGLSVIASKELYKEALPGERVTFNALIQNPLSKTMDFNINVEGPEGWIHVLKINNARVSRIVLEGGSKASLTLEVYVPASAMPGSYSFELRVWNSLFDERENFTLAVQRGFPLIVAESTSPSLDVYTGSNAVYVIKLSNLGLRSATVSFSIEGLPEDFTYSIKDEQNNIVSRILIKAGGTRTIKLVVKTPVNAEPQLVKFNFTASADGSSATLPLELNILGKYEISYLTENFYFELYIGDKGAFELEVKNTGFNEIRNVKVTVTKVPTGFTVTVEPEVVDRLKPGESCVFKLNIEASGELNTGDYYIVLQAVSDEVSANKVALHIFLKQRTETTLIWAVVVVAVIVALLIVYLKYGRR